MALLQLLQDEEWDKAEELLERTRAHDELLPAATDAEGRGPLHVLYFEESDEETTLPLLQLMLECRGVVVDARDSAGRTPFLWAAFQGAEARRAVELLLASGADAAAVDADGMSAVDLAWESYMMDERVHLEEWKMVTMLEEAGAVSSAATLRAMRADAGFDIFAELKRFQAAISDANACAKAAAEELAALKSVPLARIFDEQAARAAGGGGGGVTGTGGGTRGAAGAAGAAGSAAWSDSTARQQQAMGAAPAAVRAAEEASILRREKQLLSAVADGAAAELLQLRGKLAAAEAAAHEWGGALLYAALPAALAFCVARWRWPLLLAEGSTQPTTDALLSTDSWGALVLLALLAALLWRLLLERKEAGGRKELAEMRAALAQQTALVARMQKEGANDLTARKAGVAGKEKAAADLLHFNMRRNANNFQTQAAAADTVETRRQRREKQELPAEEEPSRAVAAIAAPPLEQQQQNEQPAAAADPQHEEEQEEDEHEEEEGEEEGGRFCAGRSSLGRSKREADDTEDATHSWSGTYKDPCCEILK